MSRRNYPERNYDLPADPGGWITASMVATAAIFMLIVAVLFGALVLLL